MFGRRCRPGPEALLAVLQALGAPIFAITDAGDALEECRCARWQRLLEPVCVSRQGDGCLRLRLPEALAGATAVLEITEENGARRRRDLRLDDVEAVVAGTAGGTR